MMSSPTTRAAQAVFHAFNSKFSWIEDGVPGPQYEAIAAVIRTAAGYLFPSDTAQQCHDRLMTIAAELEGAPPLQVARPTDQELKTFACEWWNKFGFTKDKATCTWMIDEIDPEHFVDFSRDLLARWGRPATTPVEGEVAELVAWLRGSNWNSKRQTLATRAADLLEQRHPAPVPVNERLPGPEDCDAEGRCWIGYPEWTYGIADTGDTDTTTPEWRLERPPLKPKGSRCWWLPAHALPLPSGEVEHD